MKDKTEPVIRDINLKVKRKNLIGVIGSVGSGKSSLLYSIVKEIPTYSGLYRCSSAIALVE